jgi:hypothetical protein
VVRLRGPWQPFNHPYKNLRGFSSSQAHPVFKPPVLLTDIVLLHFGCGCYFNKSAMPILCQKEPETIDLMEKTVMELSNSSKINVIGETKRNNEHLLKTVYLSF